MVSSWFAGEGNREPISIILKSLYPQNKVRNERSRFSQLILEHGEKCLQDWAVVAYSSPEVIDPSSPSSPGRKKGIRWEQAPKKSSQGARPGSSRNTTQTQLNKDSAPSANMTKVEGRLHLCSKSIVFEPNDSCRSIVRCPFQRMEEAPTEYPSDESFAAMCIQCLVSKHTLVVQNHRPFETIEVPARFRFTFLHSTPGMFVALCEDLYRLSKMQTHAAAQVVELNKLLQPMLDRPFNVSNLIDVREQTMISSMRSHILRPLQSQPGVMAVTADRIYFQPAMGVLDNSSEARAQHWLQRDIIAVARRYKGLRDSALEVYWKDQTSTLFAFDRRHDREQVIRVLPTDATCLTDREFLVTIFKEWQKGKISNFEYLLAVNSAAGRSFHDLSRYPVFPWVIADFETNKLDFTSSKTFRDLSKPVGALNKERLGYFEQRLEGMGDMEEAFLYGTHYSAPGYVLYYLVRSMPEHMLCLQNGKFDAPDRMFFSVLSCFNCAMTNHADVKELIPEFYNPDNNFDFLINARGLQLGATQSGDRVNDVQLPPWARSGRDFIRKNRKALESDLCTENLPRWIDLIFGYQSRGDSALEAKNLFHGNAYLGPNDLADMASEEERTQAELHATEFGIVPDQLFREAHPGRGNLEIGDSFIFVDIGRASSKDDSQKEAWELLDSAAVPEHSDPPFMATKPRTEADTVVYQVSQEEWTKQAPNLALSGMGEHVGTGATAPVHSFSSVKSEETTTRPVASTASVSMSPSSSAWDMKVIERKKIHNEAVSGCAIIVEEDTTTQAPVLVSTSLDGGLFVQKVSLQFDSPEESDSGGLAATFSRFSYNTILNRAGQVAQTGQSKLVEHRTHSARDPLASLVLASDGSGGQVAFAGGHDDVIIAYGVNSSCAVASVYSHRDAVTGLDLITRTPLHPDSSLWLDGSTHILVSGSWDATVKVWSVTISAGETVSISREPVAELFDAESAIVSVSTETIPTGGILVAAGCADGSFSVWNIHNDGVQVLVHSERAKKGSGPCSVVQWAMASGGIHLFTAFSTGKIASYKIAEGVLQRQAAVSIGVSILSLRYSDNFLLVGCADGALRLIPLSNVSKFDGSPTLWNSVNNKAAPAITSIGLVHVSTGNTTSRCICCTGAEDGSVALFELKRQ